MTGLLDSLDLFTPDPKRRKTWSSGKRKKRLTSGSDAAFACGIASRLRGAIDGVPPWPSIGATSKSYMAHATRPMPNTKKRPPPADEESQPQYLPVVLSELKLEFTKAHRSLENAATAEAAGDPLQEGEAQGVTRLNCSKHELWMFEVTMDLGGVGIIVLQEARLVRFAWHWYDRFFTLAGLHPQPQCQRSGSATGFRREAD